MNSVIKSSLYFVLLLIVVGLSACANVPKPVPTDTALYYQPEQGEQLLNRFAPLFLVKIIWQTLIELVQCEPLRIRSCL